MDTVSPVELGRVSPFLPSENPWKWGEIPKFLSKKDILRFCFFPLVISWLCGKYSYLSPRRVEFNPPSFHTFFLFLLNLILYQQIILFLTLSKFAWFLARHERKINLNDFINPTLKFIRLYFMKIQWKKAILLWLWCGLIWKCFWMQNETKIEKNKKYQSWGGFEPGPTG